MRWNRTRCEFKHAQTCLLQSSRMAPFKSCNKVIPGTLQPQHVYVITLRPIHQAPLNYYRVIILTFLEENTSQSSLLYNSLHSFFSHSYGVRPPAGAGNFSLRRRLQTGSGAPQTTYSMGIEGSFSEIKRSVREVGHSPRLGIRGSLPPLP